MAKQQSTISTSKQAEVTLSRNANTVLNAKAISDKKSIAVDLLDLPDTKIILDIDAPPPFDRTLLQRYSAVIFVIDLSDDYVDALTKLCALAVRSCKMRERIDFEVLLHKADAIDEMDRQGTNGLEIYNGRCIT